MKLRHVGFALATLLACSFGQARASFLFDPDGNGSGGSYQVGSFDFLTGNSLSKGVLEGESWTLYYQASLGSLVNPSGNAIAGTGLNENYEITAVVGISVRTTFFSPSMISFELDPTGGTNFLDLYYDTNVNANALEGTGYNDGTLIMSATATEDLQGIFAIFNRVSNLDQFNTNNWAGTQTLEGIGAFATSAEVTFANTDFFKLGPDEFLSSMFVNSSEISAYRQTDPSRQFWDGTGYIDADVGPINIASGPDALLQADANASFQVEVIPEASSLALLGLASAVFGLGMGRKRLARSES